MIFKIMFLFKTYINPILKFNAMGENYARNTLKLLK